jgi:hypothetical protein
MPKTITMHTPALFATEDCTNAWMQFPKSSEKKVFPQMVILTGTRFFCLNLTKCNKNETFKANPLIGVQATTRLGIFERFCPCSKGLAR